MESKIGDNWNFRRPYRFAILVRKESTKQEETACTYAKNVLQNVPSFFTLANVSEMPHFPADLFFISAIYGDIPLLPSHFDDTLRNSRNFMLAMV